MDGMTSLAERQFHGDASFGAFVAALASLGGRALVIRHGERVVRPGYHVTEVKAASFATLDCGGNPDAWKEVIVQVEDLAPEGASDFLTADKLQRILAQVAQRIALDTEARLTFEVGPPGAAMQVFDVDALRPEGDRVALRLVPRSAICKPRHRAQQMAAASGACCGHEMERSKCCLKADSESIRDLQSADIAEH
jgi:hypothetical protein